LWVDYGPLRDARVGVQAHGGIGQRSAIYGRSIELSDGHSGVGSAQTTDLPPTVILVK
jgi:hypothetical protein